ncbi:MAG: sigma 54-interacting transcriptional regulator [Desulfobacteraceae bacterium]
MTDIKCNQCQKHGIFDPIKPSLLHRAVIQCSLSGIIIFQDEKVVFSNPALRKIVGLTEEEVLETNYFDLVDPRDRGAVRRKAIGLMKARSSPDGFEFRMVTATGEIRWMHLLATAIYYQGKPAILANILDIQERKQAEKLQRERSRLQKTLIDTLPYPAMLVRRDRIILAANLPALNLGARIGDFCNNGFGRHAIGSVSAELVQCNAAGTAFTKNIKCGFCLADQAMETKKPQVSKEMEAFGGIWDLFWIPVDQETYLHYGIDVTEQRRIERTVRNSEERYRLITDTMNDGLSIQNRAGIITQVNRRFCDLIGFTRMELIGRPLADLLFDRDESAIDTASVQSKFTTSTAFLHHKDGHMIDVSVKIESLRDDHGNLKGHFAFFSDVTELNRLRRHSSSHGFENIIGDDVSMRRLFADIIDVATCEFPVLIQGETGAGKELVAQAIHKRSQRKDQMFVPVHCAALPEGLLESELFGHVKGAFTGAIRDKKGRFELAHGGTIFLDEIGELSIAMQVKLLRILQEGIFERVGDHHTTHVDVRVVSATNKDLEREMTEGRFRRDLYYRLCVIPILVPPLRKRKHDIFLLADHFISSAANHSAGRKPNISNETLRLLRSYDWPGNVRELKNVIYSASVKSKGNPIQPRHLPAAIVSRSTHSTHRRRRRKLDHARLQDALRRTGGNKRQAARLLGVHRSTLYRFLAATGRED